MAHFKLSLIVPSNDNAFSEVNLETETYLATVITDYDSQRNVYEKTKSTTSLLDNYPVTYTYNEKLSEHQNGQQELSFSMDDKILIDDEWIENPFSRILRNGVQLELQDKFNNRKLFTVNKITYSFNNISITYNITCQDSFSYQLSRQNSGYVLNNDETSTDFIGALDIDQWAARIVKDCYIPYNYVSLDTGIYLDRDGVVHTYEVAGDDVENSVPPFTSSAYKIIKPIYNKNDYADYYETFVFSASNSNADAALIAVADILGLQLNIIEGLDHVQNNGEPIRYKRLFYFGPKKNPETSGLTYSPLRDIQNFGLTFSGDSLTTILNVSSTTVDDEEVGLFPTVPPFFSQLFMDTSWAQSVYYPGFFLEAVKGKQYSNIESFVYDAVSCIKIDNKAFLDVSKLNWPTKWPVYYNKIKFYWDRQNYSEISGDTAGIYIPFQSNKQIGIAFAASSDATIYYQDDEILASDIAAYNSAPSSTQRAYVVVPWSSAENMPRIERFYFTLTRDYSAEEIEFATIADQCPWLENKLIDFSYFALQGLLSRYEYDTLMSWISNKLRIINGQLMCYSGAYYEKIHERVEQLALLQQDLDTLGAQFEADIISPYAENGAIHSNLTVLNEQYNRLFHPTTDISPTPLLGLNKVIGETFNKYFNSEQRFFKNMYEFRKYFESPNIYSLQHNTELQDVTYTVSVETDHTGRDKVFVSFGDTTGFASINSDHSIIYQPDDETWKEAYPLDTLYSYKSSTKNYIEEKIPNPYTFREFYTPIVTANTRTIIPDGHYYNPENTYLLHKDKYEEICGEIDPDYKADEDYVRLKYSDIVKIFAYQELLRSQNPPEGHSSDEYRYYIRNTTQKVPFEWVRANLSVIKEAINPKGWPGLSIIAKLNKNIDLDKINTWESNSNILSIFWQLYKSMLPIDNLYIKDYDLRYITKSTESENVNYDWSLYDENGKPVSSTDYQPFFAVPYLSFYDNVASTIFSSENDTSLSMNLLFYWEELKNKMTNSKYYAHYEDTTAVKNWSLAKWISVGAVFLVPGLGHLALLTSVIGETISGLTTHATWGIKDEMDYRLSAYDGHSWQQLTKNNEHNDSETLGDLVARKGDSHWVNLVRNEDSELTIRALTESWWESSLYPTIDIEDPTEKTQYKHYANYYKHIVATYSQGAPSHDDTADQKDTFAAATGYQCVDSNGLALRSINRDYYWVNNKYARFCKKTDYFNYQDTYYFVDADKLNRDNLPDRFSTIKYYSLLENNDKIEFTSVYTLDELKSKKYTFEELITAINNSATHGSDPSNPKNYISFVEEDSNHEKIIIKNVQTDRSGETLTKYYYIIHEEPYEKFFVSSNTTENALNPNSWTISHIDIKDRLYRVFDDCPLQLNEIYLNSIKNSNLEDTLFYIPAQDSDLVKISDLETEDQDKYWYGSTVEGQEYDAINTHWYIGPSLDDRTYSIEQIFENGDQNKYLFLKNSSFEISECVPINSTITKDLTVTLTYYDIADGVVIIDKTKDTIPIPIEAIFDTHQTISDYIKVLKPDILSIKISRTINNSIDISSMTNGEFWYYFNDRTDIPDLFTNAAVIATQLTTCWSSAYTASQYCQWFLPEYWQDYKESSRNMFAPSIWTVETITSGNDRIKKVKLKDNIVPYVDIYNYNGKTELTNYLFQYHNADGKPGNIEEYEINGLEELISNAAVQDAINHIFADTGLNNRLTVQKYGTRTYYYYVSGGLERKNIAHYLDGAGKVYDFYDGLYCMQLRLLLSRYKDVDMPLYTRLVDQKLKIWRDLYARYPGIFLENNYSNADARTSQQLLKMAQLAFKDYTAPEKQYNITFIDAAALDGYEGQELRIGDNILIRTSDYYDAVDEVYRALNQYLFITDISYSLRQDTDIQLTVNNIKYQDKLLQSLVKLIR